MHFQLSTLWRFILALLLLGSAAPRAIDRSSLQKLGLLLGMPLNRNPAVTKQEDLPTFMNSIYSCWKADPADDCLPGYHGKDVNLLRTFLGTVDASPSNALHTYNKARELMNSLEMSFNVSISNRQVDTIRYTMLRLYRQPLAPHQLEAVKNKCGSDSIILQLYSHSGTIGNLSTFSLRAVHPLSVSNLAEEEWVEFLNLTRMYKDIIDSQLDSTQGNVTSKNVHFRLAVRAPCSSITPTELGFVTATSKQKPQLVEYAENALQKEMIFSRVVSLLATADFQNSRSKRQAKVEMDDGVMGSGNFLPEPHNNSSDAMTQSDESAPPTMLHPLPTNYKHIGCKLYHYEISFADLPVTKHIVSPVKYSANICAGHCTAFSNINNMHAVIQSLANLFNDQIPPPCCVPKPGTFNPLTAIVPGETEDQLSLRIYSDMTANECECL